MIDAATLLPWSEPSPVATGRGNTIDDAKRMSNVAAPIEPGTNDTNAKSPRFALLGGISCQPRFNLRGVAGFLVMLNHTVLARFWAKVSRAGENECWVWTASTTKFGHGKMLVDGKLLGAHVISWMIHRGTVTQSILHKCDNPPCVNPNHLFEGDQRDNVHDAMSKGRLKPGIGTSKPNSVLTPNKVIVLRQRFAAGNVTCVTLANELGISDETVRAAITRRTWKHVQ